MLGIPLRYLLKHPVAGLADLAADPLQVWTTIQDAYVAQREYRGPQCAYKSDDNWEQHLHHHIGVSWPCDCTSAFWGLWAQVIRELEESGIRPGPQSFQNWNDGDAGLVRTIWCLVRHLKPKRVVETGVAHGVTSRFVLEALERNGSGHLWSIDLPPWKGVGEIKSVWPSGRVMHSDGHTLRVRAGDAFRSCFLKSARLTSSFTIACTLNAMYGLSWIERGRL